MMRRRIPVDGESSFRDHPVSLEFRDLTSDPADLTLLAAFYNDVYIAGFPDPDERESLENMQNYLRLKRDGWYGANNYHILIAVEGGRPVACSISDYLSQPNAGVIEFLLVDTRLRSRGLGRQLHDATETLLLADSLRAGQDRLNCIAIEMNDPYRLDPADDNMDPFARARLWGRWGYGALGFPYIQPALSDDQGPVEYLILGAKPLDPQLRLGFPPALVRSIVAGYLRWAMRIDDPEADPTFQDMSADLIRRNSVSWTPFGVYLGDDPARPLHVREVTSIADADFAALMQLYRGSFPPGPAAIDESAFEQALQTRSPANPVDREAGLYHLWAVRDFADSPAAGLASFFSFPAGGFVGYVALEPPLRGLWRLPLLIARMEEQMIRDCGPVGGWFFETTRRSPTDAALRRLGFHRLQVDYVSPSHAVLGGTDPGEQSLSLYFKPLGRPGQPLQLTRAGLLAAARAWLRGVYGLEEPCESSTWRRLITSLQDLRDGDQLAAAH